MLPNFIIIGSTKCASSSLHFYLNQHPEICMSNVKETGFFSLQYDKGLDFYKQYFKEATNEKALGETTPTYCFLPYVAQRIKQHFPDIKLILCIRNPVDRAFSSWLMKTGLGKETMSFRQSMDVSRKMLEYTRAKLAGPEGESYWIDNNKNYSEDEERPRTYILAGEYAKIVKLYRQYFNNDQLKVIFFDDLKNKQQETLSGIFRFLEVDDSFIVPNQEAVNYQIDRTANEIMFRFFGRKLGRSLIHLVPKNIKNRFRKTLKAKTPPKLTSEERFYYCQMFKDDVAELEKILDKDLSHWKPDKESKLISA